MKVRDRIKELQGKSVEELRALLREERERLRVLRFDLAAGKVKNVSEIRGIRKDIARIATFITKGGEAKK
jgi:ribosomal protein L29